MNTTERYGTLSSGLGEALMAVTNDEGLSVRKAVDWCGSGVTVREVTRLRGLAHDCCTATQ